MKTYLYSMHQVLPHFPACLCNSFLSILKVYSDEMQPKFARVTAAVRGYLTRRLLKTKKVQDVIKTINVSSYCGETLCRYVSVWFHKIKIGIYVPLDMHVSGGRGGRGSWPYDLDLDLLAFDSLWVWTWAWCFTDSSCFFSARHFRRGVLGNLLIWKLFS